ncbi:MAG: (2Fe-2S)-binding protein [Burkholderiaceae bacterium]
MIVCVCHNVSDKAIRRALDAGAKSMEDIRLQLNVASCCGKCSEFASTLVRAHIEDTQLTELRRVMTA